MNYHLSKSRYNRGLHCNKQLWLNTHKHNLGTYKKKFSTLIGDKVGVGATRNYPNGLLVDIPFNKHAEAVKKTIDLIDDLKIQAIFEAAFTFNDIHIRVDILERLNDNSWGIREVKSSKFIKENFYHDIAIQYYVLKNLGYNIISSQILHTNGEYILDTPEVEWSKFFIAKEYLETLEENEEEIKDNVIHLKDIQNLKEEPVIQPNKSFCDGCEFWDYCVKDKPSDWIAMIPRLVGKRKQALETKKIESISEIPRDFQFTDKQEIVVQSTRDNAVFKSRAFHHNLKKYKPPVYCFDFETLMCAIPTIRGTKPFETLPFQWSLHYLDSDGSVMHWEFLARENIDYRREMIECFINIVKENQNKIITYNQSFEKSVLKKMGILYPEYSDILDSIIDRVIDLKIFIEDNYYHPDFKGSYSLKKVLPAVLPNESQYSEGQVSDGEQAQETFYHLLFEKNDDVNKKNIISSLLEYCKKDTESLILIYKYFEKL
jgi:hypothetical protein